MHELHASPQPCEIAAQRVCVCTESVYLDYALEMVRVHVCITIITLYLLRSMLVLIIDENLFSIFLVRLRSDIFFQF